MKNTRIGKNELEKKTISIQAISIFHKNEHEKRKAMRATYWYYFILCTILQSFQFIKKNL